MNMDQMSERSDRLVNAISGAMMSSMEAASEKVELAAQVSRVRTRMDAFASVMDAIGGQKDALAAKLVGCSPAMKMLIERQLEILTTQEIGVLSRMGVDGETAQKALTVADRGDEDSEPVATHRRDRSRFTPVALNGHK